jgi:hypothetical protein
MLLNFGDQMGTGISNEARRRSLALLLSSIRYPAIVNYPRGRQFKICCPQQHQLRVLQQQLLLRQHLVPFVRLDHMCSKSFLVSLGFFSGFFRTFGYTVGFESIPKRVELPVDCIGSTFSCIELPVDCIGSTFNCIIFPGNLIGS